MLFVLLSHSGNANLFFHKYINFSRGGKIGVYLFFVLSAYLLDRQIALAFVQNKAKIKYWKNYFLRRFLRIFPLFTLSLVVHGALSHWGWNTVIRSPYDIPKHLLLLDGRSIFWSIPVEFKYYVLSPAIMAICHYLFRWNVTRIQFFFLSLIILSITIEQKWGLNQISTFKFFPVFLIGTFFSIHEVFSKNEPSNTRLLPVLIDLLGVLSGIAIIFSMPYYFLLLSATPVDFQKPTFYLPYALLWGGILFSVRNGVGYIKRFFETPFLRIVGTISFSMYLFHMPVLKLITANNHIPEPLKIYLFFFISFFVSVLSYLAIERPLSKIKLTF